MVRNRITLVALMLTLALCATPALGDTWDAVADWSSEPSNPNGAWSYMMGWVAAENPLNTFDGGEIPGLERWGRFDSPENLKPYIGKNVSDADIELNGMVIPAGALVMDTLTNPLGPDISPIIRWTAPESGTYDIEIHIRNLSDGEPVDGAKPDGIEWLVYYSGFNIAHSKNLDPGQEDTFVRNRTYLEAGMWYTVVFNSRANNLEDLSVVSFVVKRSN